MRKLQKSGPAADPVFESKGSVAFAGWVGSVTVNEAARVLNTSRQSIWNWCSGVHRPSWAFMQQIELEADIPVADWRREP